jgi:hypothetical protein
MQKLVVTLCVCAFLVVGIPAFAQKQNSLVGTWERISMIIADGSVGQPPSPPAFLIFSAEGYYAQLAIPSGRSKLHKPLDQLTKEELLDQFRYVEGRRGKYTITGNKLARRYDASTNPNQEGSEQVQQFRIESDLLILTATSADSKAEARFKRVK